MAVGTSGVWAPSQQVCKAESFAKPEMVSVRSALPEGNQAGMSRCFGEHQNILWPYIPIKIFPLSIALPLFVGFFSLFL